MIFDSVDPSNSLRATIWIRKCLDTVTFADLRMRFENRRTLRQTERLTRFIDMQIELIYWFGMSH